MHHLKGGIEKHTAQRLPPAPPGLNIELAHKENLCFSPACFNIKAGGGRGERAVSVPCLATLLKWCRISSTNRRESILRYEVRRERNTLGWNHQNSRMGLQLRCLVGPCEDFTMASRGLHEGFTRASRGLLCFTSICAHALRGSSVRLNMYKYAPWLV